MKYDGYDFFTFRVEKGVLFVTIDNPSVDILSLKVATELLYLSSEVTGDREIQVVVFDSTNPDFSSQATMLETWFNSKMKRS